MDMVLKEKWEDTSGLLINPCKYFFLELSAQEVRDVNNQRDDHDINYTCQEIILTFMALNMTASGNLVSSIQNNWEL